METRTTDKDIKVSLNVMVKKRQTGFWITLKKIFSDLIGSQRDTPAAAATEAALAVAAGVAAAIRKLGFATDSAGRRLWPGRVGGLGLLAQLLHLVLVQLKLLVQLPAECTEAALTGAGFDSIRASHR